MSEQPTHDVAPRRRRGRPARVSRDSIVEAARGLGVDQLSVQAVADRLGVDRSTILYHFADRDELFAVVASVTLGSELDGWTPPESDDWRDWVRDYAYRVHDALTRHATVAVFVRLPLGSDVGALAPVEGLIQKLSAAGFDDGTIAHAVAYISEVVHATALNEILVARGGHPQGPELARYLAAQPAGVAPGLRRLVEADPLGNADHFAFAVRMVIAGLELGLTSG